MDQRKIIDKVWHQPFYFIAFGFGSGLIPKAPGTWGTCAAIPLFFLFSLLSWPLYAVLVMLAFFFGIYVCDVVARDVGVPDHSGIVWDEMVGYWITMFMAPAGWQWVLSGFVLFRFFDILKPWPIRWIDQKVHGGLGIMLDDVLAAIPAWLLLHLAHTMMGAQ